MRKSILAMLTIALFSGLHADSFFDKVFVSGEFLWWKAECDNFSSRAIFTDFSTVIDGVSTTQVRPYTFGYDPGFRVSVDTELMLCDCTIAPYASFTNFRSTTNQNVNFTLTQADTAYTFAFPLNYFNFFDSSFLTTVGDTFAYSGSADFLYNRLDIGLSKSVCVSSCFSVIPKAAFTYIHTRQTVTDVVNLVLDASPFLELGSSGAHFSGCGLTLGFDSNYDLACGLSFYGGASVTEVWGELKADFDEEVYQGTEPVGPVFFGGSQSSSMHIARWLADIQLGVQYQTCVSDWFQIAARIGWEFVYLPDQMYFNQQTRPEAFKINGIVAGLGIGF